MTTDEQPPDGDTGRDEPSLTELLRAGPEVHDLRRPAVDRVLAELADIKVAHEELRVAEEEMRALQEQVTQLLLQHDAERRWRGQMSALVPVGLCVTDANGTLVDANPALAAHLGAGPHRLRGKPLSVFLARDDVRAFRTTLRALSSGTATEHQLAVTVQPRHLAPVRARLFGFTETADHRPSAARIQWVLVPEETSDDHQDADSATPGAPSRSQQGTDLDQGDQPMPAAAVIGLATALSELSALPVGELDRQRLLSRMATLVRGAVPGAQWVSITLGSPMEPQRLGSDSSEAQRFDGLEVRAGEGPCWDAYRLGTVVTVDDVSVDVRWPALAKVAQPTAVRSVLALPVREEGTTTGSVNVYSGEVGAFGASGRRIAELATAAVAGVLQNVAERESMRTLAANLERALTSRAVIDQAKGVIMAKLEVNADDAFARLVNLSSRLNVKVRDLATLIVEGHADAVLRAAD